MSTHVISRGIKNGQRTAQVVVKSVNAKGVTVSKTKHLVYGRDKSGAQLIEG